MCATGRSHTRPCPRGTISMCGRWCYHTWCVRQVRDKEESYKAMLHEVRESRGEAC